MELIQFFIDFVLHADQHLAFLLQNYGGWVYAILFLIIFCETGLVVTPFLPGDSLLFAAGAIIATTNSLNITLLCLILFVSAVLGNTSNYLIGTFIGPKIFEQEKIKFLKKDYLIKTQKFYEKQGGKAVVISRFLPIFRTFVPFVAGIGKMKWHKFMIYNILGAFFWVIPITFLGYALGENEWVKRNFSVVVLAIIFITVLPAVIGFAKEIFESKKNTNS